MKLFSKNQKNSEKEYEYNRNGAWNYYTRVFSDGQEALVEYNKDVLDEKLRENNPRCFRVIFHIDPENCNSFGIPFKEERDLIIKQEASLVKKLAGIRYVLAGTIAFGSIVDLVFQTGEREKFISAVNDWRKNHREYKVEGVEREGWGYCDKNIRPDEYALLQISNRTQVAALINSGKDPAGEYRLLHSFAGKKKGLNSVCEQFKTAGFDEVSNDGANLVLAHYAGLDYYAICELTKRLLSYSRKNSVEYTGWRTDTDAD